MINRNNNYSSINKNSLLDILKRKKGTLIAVSGVLATVTILSGCSQTKEEFYSQPQYMRPPVTHEITDNSVAIISEDVTQTDLFSFEPSVQYMAIENTNLDDTYELSNYTKLVQLSLDNNVITSADGLSESPDLMLLSVRNNNIKDLDLTKFKSLRVLYIEGNYNLYTKEMLDYCKNNNITVDIEEKDVENVEALKEMLKDLDLEGKTEEEKEKIICDFVCKHMKYDTIGAASDFKSQEYNQNILENSIKGNGVCINYAEMFTAMCQLSGVDCFTVKGFADNSTFNTGRGGAHAWNLVEIDGQYMLCDPTWIDSYGIFGDIYYNKSGEQGTKDFEKRHDSGEIVELLTSNSNQKSSSINKANSGIDKFFEGVDKYVEVLQTEHGISREQLMQYMLTGAAAGTVILIGSSACRKLQPVIDEKKKKNQLLKAQKEEEKERLRQEKQKLQEAMRQELINQKQAIEASKVPVVQEVKQVEKPRELTLDEILATLPNDEERIEYLDQRADEKLTEIATLQVEEEFERREIPEKTPEEIEKAKQELKTLFVTKSLSSKGRALYRCKKFGYFPEDKTLDQIVSNDDNLMILSTINLYSNVDEKMLTEYSRLYAKSANLKVQIGQPLDQELMDRSKGI
jgi:hypothetical protein